MIVLKDTSKLIVKGGTSCIYTDSIRRRVLSLTRKFDDDGRAHAPALSITDDMPESGGGGESAAAPEVAASDDDDGDGDGDPDSDRRRRPRSKSSHPSFPPALLAFEPLSHYVSFGRSRIYQLIAAGEFPQPIKVGKSSRWVKAEIDAWISKQATSQRVEA